MYSRSPSIYRDGISDNEFPLPRIWFINKDKSNLIQYQPDCFLFNWRKLPGAEIYPRYSVISKLFENSHQIFASFVKENELGNIKYQECELTYINHITKGNGWDKPSDIGRVLKDLKWTNKKSRFLPEPHTLQWNSAFLLPEDFGRLNISAKHGLRQHDKCPVLIIEITAKGLGGDLGLERVSEWFNIAHEWIVQAFADITCPEIQKEIWQRLDNK